MVRKATNAYGSISYGCEIKLWIKENLRMNAIDLLKQDHDAVDELFKKVEDTPPSKHPPLFKRIKGELDTHAHIEETIFYPLLKSKGDKELVDITMEGLEEHAQIKKFLREITRSTSKDKREAKLKVLMEDTRHHVKEEESDMFPMVRDQFDAEELDALGDRMEIEKQKFQKKKGISSRRTKPVKGSVAKIIDKAKNLVTGITGTTPVREKRKGSRANGKTPSGSRKKVTTGTRPKAKKSSART